jgi:two-component system cell cycle sensor histidine kinase/response regulator CckA
MVISSYAELMLHSLAPQHPLRRNLDEIQKASRWTADLTRQLLAFGRKQIQTLQLLDLNLIIEDVDKMLPRLIGEDIELVFVPGERLGKVKADPLQIEQVLMNLVANARDAMPKCGRLVIETASVRLDEAYVQEHSVVPRGQYILLTVTDSGMGIAPEHVLHIFEPFYTAKGGRQGHRPGPGHGVRHCQTERWVHLGVQRARAGNDLQDLFAPGAASKTCIAAYFPARGRLSARLRNFAAGGR